MLQIVALPVQEIVAQPSPKNSTIAFVPPLTVRMLHSLRMTSFGAVQPCKAPVSLTPIFVGYFTSHGKPLITSTASAPPTPEAIMPRPPAFGVCESVPIIMLPGKA